jgi:hypothetical protein
MTFGIDTMLSCWFVMVTRPGDDTPFIYEPSTGNARVAEVIAEHAKDGPEKDAKLLAVTLDLDPSEGDAEAELEALEPFRHIERESIEESEKR